MKSVFKVFGGAALGLACLAASARADLVLSGSTAGYFQGVSSGSTVITNTPDGSYAEFRTGVPIAGKTLKSGVRFDAKDFSNIHSGDMFSIGFITYYNGRTLIGTSSDSANLDFWLNLTDPSVPPFQLTTITFGIDATVNDGALVPDRFTATFAQPAQVKINDNLVRFQINNLPGFTEVAEDSWEKLAEVTVTFTPVPEPATYGMIASAGLLGLAAYRRLRGRQGSRQVAATVT